MKTFIMLFVYLAIVAMCYFVNKKIAINGNRKSCEWNWENVIVNILISVFTPFSIILWIYVICCNLPAISEKPPRWL